MDHTMSEESGVYTENVLYICENVACSQFYVLNVPLDEQAQKCPKSASHGFLKAVKEIKYHKYNTCENRACKSYLSAAVAADDDGRCEVCNQPVVTVGELMEQLDELPDYREVAESEDLPHPLASLKAKVEDAEKFKSGHHPSKTSKGKPKTGSAQALARHQKADHSDAVLKKAHAKFLSGALEGAMAWKKKAGGGITKYQSGQYDKLSGRAVIQIKRFGGDVPVDDSED